MSELRLVINGNGGSARKPDSALLKELAARDKVDERYLSRVLRLAALSPEIVELIVEGRQPPDLTLQTLLTRRRNLPLDWVAQQQALGIDEVAARSVAARSNN